MAEALLRIALTNLVTLLKNEFSTITGIKSKAEKLSATLELINAVLEDAETKQLTDPPVKVWLQQLKDAVHVLDDILDECSIETRRLSGSSSISPKNMKFRRYIGKRLKKITKRFDQIGESKNKFFLREGVTVKENPIDVVEWRQTSSFIHEPKMLGRQDDKEKIVEFLLTQTKDCEFLSIYPIVGLGGVGKTMLAQFVYNDVRVSADFKTKIWVCVSEAFSVKRIMSSVIESITGEKCEALDLDVIQRKVQQQLQGKRYLLVLDDVWNKNEQLEFGLTQEKWNMLKSVFSFGSKGCSILVSTRDEAVAEIMGTCQAHNLSGLSDEDGWLLFKKYAFRHVRDESSELVQIGKEVVKKCGGLPLATKALGCLLGSRSGEKEWLEIKESKFWALPQENSILPSLRLSYFHLTPTLKRCFAFCSIFPKDTKMMKEELIHLWMANGFISSRENLEVEDVGNMIWNELHQKSFFQDIKMNDYSEEVCFKMHDLIHDLAQSISGQECMFLENPNITNLSKSTHHVCFQSQDSFKPILSFWPGASHIVYSDTSILYNDSAFKKVESLRTLYQLNRNVGIQPDNFPTNFSTLRVLCTSSLLLSSLESLIHLRYLELRNMEIETLPKSICKLQKLEILKLEYIHGLTRLPDDLVGLQNLRHLVIENCNSLFQLFPNIGKLSFLRTLSLYIVSLEIGQSLAELCDLNLGGKLNIKGLEGVGSLSEAQKAKLKDKKELKELCLSWRKNVGSTTTPTISPEQVLEVLQPHSNLKRLKIHCYQGLCFPNWIKTLSSLVSLELMSCTECVRLPSSFAKLPCLKMLKLYDMDDLKYMDDDDDDDEESRNDTKVRVFPSLEVLELKRLPNLKRLLKVERGVMFPSLSTLKIERCPNIEWECIPTVEYLDIDGINDSLLMSIYEGKRITSF